MLEVENGGVAVEGQVETQELGVTELTGVVPGLKGGKRKGSKRKQHVADAVFVEVFQSAATAAEACEKLAMPDENGVAVPMTENNLYLRAAKLRKAGIPLKDGFSRQAKDIAALTELAKRFAPGAKVEAPVAPVEGEVAAS